MFSGMILCKTLDSCHTIQNQTPQFIKINHQSLQMSSRVQQHLYSKSKIIHPMQGHASKSNQYLSQSVLSLVQEGEQVSLSGAGQVLANDANLRVVTLQSIQFFFSTFKPHLMKHSLLSFLKLKKLQKRIENNIINIHVSNP